MTSGLSNPRATLLVLAGLGLGLASAFGCRVFDGKPTTQDQRSGSLAANSVAGADGTPNGAEAPPVLAGSGDDPAVLLPAAAGTASGPAPVPLPAALPASGSAPVAPAEPVGGPGTGSAAASPTAPVSAPTPAPVIAPVVTVVPAVGFDDRLRVKNLTQLRAALKVCVGPEMTGIAAGMLLPVDGTLPAPDASGRFPFLNAVRYPAGTDVLEAESAFLLDPARSERYGADADALSAPYLRSLEMVANVVAFNCAATNPLCDCSTKALAEALTQRCLSAFPPTAPAFLAAQAALASQCAEGPAGMRKAVASLLASYAFAAKN